MQRKIEQLRRRIVQMPRLVAVPMALLVLFGSLLSFVFTHEIVTITDSDGTQQTLLTASEAPEEILLAAGVAVGEHDEVVYTQAEKDVANIVVNRAFPVSLKADGQLFTTKLVRGTVGDLVEMSGVALGPDDYVEPGLASPLKEDVQVSVHRVTYTEESSREEVPSEAVEAYKESLPVDADGEIEFAESRNGMYDVTYRNRLVDGVLESSEIVQLVAVVQPRDPGSTEFIPGVPCSTIEGFDGVEMGPDGLPTSYTRVMQGAVATAYSSSGGRGASGLGLYCGTVAVNPNVIPYGTRMYITSQDGQFVYGFAIATDCGTAMMEGRVDVDLYFATNAECLRFGKRALDIYILD